ncbi:hypothetical protein GEMRC1_003766 [Eukaryota sp. GEM-RC1]
MSFYKPVETFGVIETTGITKASKRIDKLVILSFLAGIYISFGAIAALIAGGRIADRGIGLLVYAAVFPVGLMFVIIAGAELFTGNTMFLIPGLLHKRIYVLDLLRVWFYSFFFNFAASYFVALVLQSSINVSPVDDFLRSIVIGKLSYGFWIIFVRAVAANWLVNLAIVLAYASNTIGGKILGIWFTIFAFIVRRFRTCCCKHVLLLLAFFIGGTGITIGSMLLALLPATLGNIIGGSGFVGVLYSYIHSVERSGRTVFPPPTPILSGEQRKYSKRPPSPIIPHGDVASNSLVQGEATEPLRSQTGDFAVSRPPRGPVLRKEVLPP